MSDKSDDLLHVPERDIEETISDLEAKEQTRAKEFLDIQELESYVDELLNSLPKLNRTKLRAELEDMVVPVKSNPHTSDLNKGLSLAQGYKDRLAEIYLLALNEYRVRDRCMEMLLDAYNSVSKASSADKRKGEATLRYAVKLFQLQAAENFLKEVEHVLANVKSAMDAISRQITLYDLQLKLGEVRKTTSSQAEEWSTTGESEWDEL